MSLARTTSFKYVAGKLQVNGGYKYMEGTSGATEGRRPHVSHNLNRHCLRLRGATVMSTSGKTLSSTYSIETLVSVSLMKKVWTLVFNWPPQSCSSSSDTWKDILEPSHRAVINGASLGSPHLFACLSSFWPLVAAVCRELEGMSHLPPALPSRGCYSGMSGSWGCWAHW